MLIHVSVNEPHHRNWQKPFFILFFLFYFIFSSFFSFLFLLHYVTNPVLSFSFFLFEHHVFYIYIMQSLIYIIIFSFCLNYNLQVFILIIYNYRFVTFSYNGEKVLFYFLIKLRTEVYVIIARSYILQYLYFFFCF